MESNEVVHSENEELAITSKVDEINPELVKIETIRHIGNHEADDEDCLVETYKIQVDTLENTVVHLRSEIDRLQGALRQQEEVSKKQFQQLVQDSELKIERLRQQCDQAVKDKENMVMKYAVSENGLLTLERQMKQKESRLKQLGKEKEALEGKVKSLTNDKVKLSQLVDTKIAEIMNWEREVEKKKDELHAQSSNLKFFQNKLKLELDSHKETQIKLEKLNQRLKEAKEETEQVRQDAQAMLRNCEPPDEDFRQKHNQLLEEYNQICTKVQSLELERLDYEQTVSKLKQQINQQQANFLDLQACRTELESTKILLQREQERVVSYVAESESLRQTNIDLQAEAEACRQREAELLTFTQKLTERNVTVQAELTAAQARAAQLDIDYTSCQRKVAALGEECKTVKEELSRVGQQRAEEKELLERHLAEKSLSAEQLAQQLQDQIGENQLLKKKHLASLKELTRELQSWRRRGDLMETATLSHGSSNTSLDTPEQRSDSEQRSEPPEPDRQRLIEKIVSVQRSNARKQEKIDFLEEHTNQLMTELQRKTRLVQALVLKQPPAALTSDAFDQNKVRNLTLNDSEMKTNFKFMRLIDVVNFKRALWTAEKKAELAKYGGIMGSLYNSKPIDETMTLELSLEINQKLQAALEDTLLKNITLKENVETLGNEIAKLTMSRSAT